MNGHDTAIEAYFSEILQRDFGFECDPDEVERFPDLELHWERPELITNSILDIDRSNVYDLHKVSAELQSVNCKAVQIRFFSEVDKGFIKYVLDFFEFTSVEHIELLLQYSELPNEDELIEICNLYHRINAITLHTSPFFEIRDINQSGVTVTYITQEIRSSSHCGVINPSLFNVTQENFLESLKFNSCLNKKISIDVNGNIKNCPSMTTFYGHIADTSFLKVVSTEAFRELWNITKDDIHVCRSCEFRYICTDCRAYTLEGDVPYNKPSKCTYDPFEAQWH